MPYIYELVGVSIAYRIHCGGGRKSIYINLVLYKRDAYLLSTSTADVGGGAPFVSRQKERYSCSTCTTRPKYSEAHCLSHPKRIKRYDFGNARMPAYQQ